MYYTTEFIGVLRTIFIVLLVIYGLRFLGRLLMPWLAKKASSKFQKMAEEQMRQRGFNPQRSERPEGQVTVEKSSSRSKNTANKRSSSDDDYVDYEVID